MKDSVNNKHRTKGHHVGLLTLSLVLALVHTLAGFFILLVASWFIAASAIAGLGFNYMLPAVVIRALAILRIASGYFSMLVGHDYLLKKLAVLRLSLFNSLEGEIQVSRKDSLDALNHQTEELASIWMSWVAGNAGAILSLLSIQLGVLLFLPALGTLVGLFILGFSLIYLAVLLTMLKIAGEMAAQRQVYQLALTQHIEAAPIWHMHPHYEDIAPTLADLRHTQKQIQLSVRLATLALFALSIAAISVAVANFATAFAGQALFVMLPMALLSVNDWLTPTLLSQQNIAQYMQAKKQFVAITQQKMDTAHAVGRDDTTIDCIELRNFAAQNTQMKMSTARFVRGSNHIVMGSSGAGKSRLLMAIAGLIAFTGERRLKPAHNDTSPTRTEQGVLNDIYYIEQFSYCLADTLRSNLSIANPQSCDAALHEVLNDVGLGHLTNLEQWLGENGRQLSGGEKKRLGIARGLLSTANVLLFDEPFEALDDENMLRVSALLNRLSQDKIVIITTHILPATLHYAQSIYLDETHQPYSYSQGETRHEQT